MSQENQWELKELLTNTLISKSEGNTTEQLLIGSDIVFSKLNQSYEEL